MYRTIRSRALVRHAAFAAFLGLIGACSQSGQAEQPSLKCRGNLLHRVAGHGLGGRLLPLARFPRIRRAPAAETPAPEQAWTSLFDGKTLEGWEVLEFGGDGEVAVEDGSIVLEFGAMLTGVAYKLEFPKTDYEISLEARRTEGIDFFCALTFPVAESHCSFIVGGWAGAVVGLSCLDGQDASSNETTKYMAFDDDRWYRIRVRVEPDRISAWIDDERVVDVDITDREIDTRIEVDLCKPLGLAAWQTTAEMRNIRYRKLD